MRIDWNTVVAMFQTHSVTASTEPRRRFAQNLRSQFLAILNTDQESILLATRSMQNRLLLPCQRSAMGKTLSSFATGTQFVLETLDGQANDLR
jgi:hypothetical protein